MSSAVLLLLDIRWEGDFHTCSYYFDAVPRTRPFQNKLHNADTAKMNLGDLVTARREVAHGSTAGSTVTEILRTLYNGLQSTQPQNHRLQAALRLESDVLPSTDSHVLSPGKAQYQLALNDAHAAHRFTRSANQIQDELKAFFERLAPIGKHHEFESFWAEITQAEMLDGATMAEALQELLNEGISRKFRCATAQKCVRVGCTFIAQAQRCFLTLKDFDRAWFSLTQANYWLGILTGQHAGVEEKRLGDAASTIQKLQDARHAESRSMRAEAIAWYDKHRGSFRSNQQTAQAIAKIVPAQVRTIVGWITAHNKTRK